MKYGSAIATCVVALAPLTGRVLGAQRGSNAVARTQVELSVVDSAGTPLAEASLELVSSSGRSSRVTTDSAGRAILVDVEPGIARVTARRVGYRPGDLSVALAAGRNTVPIILSRVTVPVLAAVRVVGDRVLLARYQEFELRRLRGENSASITEDEIRKRSPVDTWQMLTNIPAMRVTQYGKAGVFAMSSRGLRMVRGKGGGYEMVPCWLRVMIDGVALADSMPELSSLLPRPSEVHGIEIFAGPATIPPQYDSTIGGGFGADANNTCGLIAIWTK